ncbi:MAG: NAD-binding protein, partial [Erythrobacter sp.]|nr:NAD-binding protein [Erythrobacter sp.]
GAVVTLSMASTPFLMMATRRIRQEPGGAQETREEPQALGARALVVGFGRFGQTVAQVLLSAGITVTMIDRRVEQIDLASDFGSKVYYGDGMRLDMLRQAGAEQVQLIMFCIDSVPDAHFIDSVAAAFPDATIYVRGFDRRSVIALANSRAQYVMREVYESAIKMARMALDNLGLGESEIERAESAYRAFDRKRLGVQIERGDIYAAQDMTRDQLRLLRGED